MDFTQIIAQLEAALAQANAGLAQFDQSIAAAQAQINAAAAQRDVYEGYVAQLEAALAAFQNA